MKKWGLLFSLVMIGFLFGYGVVAKAFLGASSYVGYFDGHTTYSGDFVFPAGMPDYSDNIHPETAFINYVEDKYHHGTPQEKTGAAFLMNVLHGNTVNQADRTPNLTTFETDVRKYDNKTGSFSGPKSNGSYNAEVIWNYNFRYDTNSMYQSNGSGDDYNDDAFYTESGHAPSIAFRNTGGDIIGIKHRCSNVVHDSANGGHQTQTPDDYAIRGRTSITVGNGPEQFGIGGDGKDDGRGGNKIVTVEISPGETKTVTFKHYLENDGPDATNNTISWRTRDTRLDDSDPNKTISDGSRQVSGVGSGNWNYLTTGNERIEIKSDGYITHGENNDDWLYSYDSGFKICRRVDYKPTSDTNSNWGVNGLPMCIKVVEKPIASCNVTGISPAVPFTGHGTTINVSLTNHSSSYGPNFNGSYWMEMGANGLVEKQQNLSSTVYPTGSTSISFTTNARGSPGQVGFEFRLYDNNGYLVKGNSNSGSPLCSTTVTWKPPIASCSIPSVTPPNPYLGHGASIAVNLINQSDAGTPGFNSSYILRQVSSDGQADQKNVSGTLSSGDSQNILFNVEARGSPGDVVFTYRLYDDVNNLVIGKTNNGNPLCQTTVTWRQLPVKPYFKAYGGDVFVGGAFDKKDSPCSNSASDYQAPTFGSISTYSKGGIYAFANSQIGASSEYAGFALGNINGSTDTDRSDDVLQYGFYTSGITMPIKQRQNTLSFANKLPSVVGSDSTYWGGYFEGSVKQLHCVTDYFYTKKSASAPTVPSVNLATITNGQYLINTSTTTSTPISGNISANPDNNRITIFVKGNVYITGNITYPACTIASCYGSGSAPKFALIVQGNIYINQDVNQLDGLYIAQPDQTNLANTGVIWTCHDGSSVAYNSTFVIGNCNHKLTFNGAVIAKQMNLWRTNDGINSDLPTDQPGTPSIPAEEFKYTPEMVIGNPFFNQSNGSQDYTVDSVITLPPVY